MSAFSVWRFTAQSLQNMNVKSWAPFTQSNRAKGTAYFSFSRWYIFQKWQTQLTNFIEFFLYCLSWSQFFLVAVFTTLFPHDYYLSTLHQNLKQGIQKQLNMQKTEKQTSSWNQKNQNFQPKVSFAHFSSDFSRAFYSIGWYTSPTRDTFSSTMKNETTVSLSSRYLLTATRPFFILSLTDACFSWVFCYSSLFSNVLQHTFSWNTPDARWSG